MSTIRFTFILVLAIAISACSLPSLEAPECAASRGVVKEFYSNHFGTDMKFSAERLEANSKYLTPELIMSLSGSSPETDVFTTNSSDIPKAFRVGGCVVADPVRTRLEIILFWRDESRSEERKIRVEAVKANDKWLIDKILY